VDAVVVGSGPNGLAAAVTLARAGLVVAVVEGADTPGGGCRTSDLTLPGFHHDVCSAVHPLLAASPFFVDSALSGIRLLQPPVAFAHPLDRGRTAAVVRSVASTAAGLGSDARAYTRLFESFVRDADEIVPAILRPIRSMPRHPRSVSRFGTLGLLPSQTLARRFETQEARALLAGVAAHSMRPLNAPLSGGFGLFLATLAHAVGWPVVEGGSGAVTEALITELVALGGRVETGRWVRSMADIPPARVTVLDVSPDQLASIGGDRIPRRSQRALSRFQYGPGVCKVDWALAGPVPWSADPCRQTCTVHVGGTFEEVARSEADANAGRHSDRPYCIVTQPGVVDSSRAPGEQQTLWAYCHVPSGSDVDMASKIETQIERFAPGFRDLILARVTKTARDMEHANPNYVGGDITSGAATLRQTVFRPTVRWNPYRTPLAGVYLGSASTPPGGGVHGMCGWAAARTALTDLGIQR
jgi:phytoene dehydrogenase-like protein